MLALTVVLLSTISLTTTTLHKAWELGHSERGSEMTQLCMHSNYNCDRHSGNKPTNTCGNYRASWPCCTLLAGISNLVKRHAIHVVITLKHQHQDKKQEYHYQFQPQPGNKTMQGRTGQDRAGQTTPVNEYTIVSTLKHHTSCDYKGPKFSVADGSW